MVTSNGEKLREMRRSFGWSQEQLAEALEVDVATISRWERNKSRPSLVNGPRIARVFANAFGAGTRISAYGLAMLPAPLVAEVKHSPYLRALTYGDEGIILLCSDVLRQYLGIFSDVIIGLPYSDILPPQSVDRYSRHVQGLIDTLNVGRAVRYVCSHDAKWWPKRTAYREFFGKRVLPNVTDWSFRDVDEHTFRQLYQDGFETI